MAEIRGVLTTLNHALPSGLDPTRLAQWRLRDGRAYSEFRADLVASLDGLNADILSAWGDMIFVTNEDHFEYPNGGAITDMPDITDLDRPEPIKGTTVGHMIDLRTKGSAIGGTKRYFRDTRPAVWQAALRDMVMRGRQTFEKQLLTRFFTNTSNALGSSGYDVPFANNSSGVTYTPPAYGGKTFASSHNHYIGYNASTPLTFTDVLNGLMQTVQEHGHEGPYITYISEADVATYRALSGYVEPVDANVIIVERGGETSGNRYFERGNIGAPLPSGGFYIGRFRGNFGETELRATARIPTGYAGLFKSYGNNDERNAIGVRVHPEVGFGFRIIEEPSYDEMYPVKSITVEVEYGISCGNDRTMGATGYLVAGGSFVNPAIS